jgi:oxidoreductase, short chain dehydrogenase/reductase family
MTFNPFTLSEKTILITGASSGIGRQCAIDCSQMGARVVLIGRNEERLAETRRQMTGNGHVVMSFDLTDFDRIGMLVADIVVRCGPLHGILHCAGISTTLPLKLMSTEQLDCFFRNNVYSAIELTREVCKIRHMPKEGGSIVFFSSIMGCVGESGKSLYGMTKGALISAVRSLACEYARRNIRFNSVSPGAILTPINADLPHMADPDLRRQLEDKHLLGLGRTEDVSNACIYLLSDASRWVTGQNLIVDGGYTVR